MRYDLIAAFWLVASLGSAFMSGWVFAHKEVSNECQRLGAFYVGNKTFSCEEK